MHGVAEECRVGKAGSDDVAWGNLDALHVHRLGLVQAELVQRLQDVNEFAAEPVLECDALDIDSARHQQYLFVLDVYALHRSSPAWKVKYLGFAEGLMSPELSWFSPFGLTASEIAAGVILCIFIYWGWDSCLAVTEETKDADKTPGRAALLSTVILLLTYLLVAVAIQAFAGFEETGIGLANEENSDDVLTIVGEPVLGAVMTSVLLLTVALDMLDPEYGFTTFGPIGGVFVIGVGMLALGVPLMIACAVRFRAFFRGETLNEDTPILVPDTGAEPVALHE
jgi:hypothetical protein